MREIPYLFGESHELKDMRHIRPNVLIAFPGDFEREGDVFVDVFGGQKAKILEHGADVASKLEEVFLGEPGYLLFTKKNRPLCGEYLGKEHFEEGGLACARVADDGYEFAGLDREGYLGDGRRRALKVYLRNVIEINHNGNDYTAECGLGKTAKD